MYYMYYYKIIILYYISLLPYFFIYTQNKNSSYFKYQGLELQTDSNTLHGSIRIVCSYTVSVSIKQLYESTTYLYSAIYCLFISYKF